jgi:YYY domain-containing protein
MMLQALLWWFIIQILALAGLPLAYRLFDRLPDHGYAFAKPVGLLGASYALWLLTTMGFLRNRWGGVVGCILLVGAVGWWFYRRPAGVGVVRAAGQAQGLPLQGAAAQDHSPLQDEAARDYPPLRAWLIQNRRVILANELLLALAFFGFVLFRAYNPEIVATEKPMELAFLNAILRSDTFPPHDPWLSGFAISYYYFGYLMMALLTRLSGLPSSVTFNLMQATVFAWTVSGAFSLAYNLVCLTDRASRSHAGIWYGLLSSVLVAIMGNLEGLLEMLHAHGLGSQAFWKWVDIKGLLQAPRSPVWHPTDTWWWWRASRVIHDRTLLGQGQEVIDEFPAFSFLLGDMHPHVLALPFLLLAFAVALQLLCAQRRLRGVRLAVVGLLLGGLGFLNTWDFPLALAIAAAAYALGQLSGSPRLTREWLTEVVSTGLGLLLIGVAAYLPFYLGFQSQAGGILPVIYNRTKLHQYGIMFGPFLVIITGFLLVELGAIRKLEGTRYEWILGLGALCVMGLSALLGRWLPFVLAAFLAAAVLVGWRRLRGTRDPGECRPGKGPAISILFSLLLFLVGLSLTMAVEFVYLKDTFGTRMNTVFKFYYQAWACFGIAGAYGVYAVLHRASRPGRVLFGGVFALTLAAGLVYPLAAFYSKADGFRGEPTLDGVAHLAYAHSDDHAAIQWLNAHASGAPVITEANGGSYTYAARISTHTGLPTLLGWGGHELQWRGNYEEPGRREPDIRTLYTAHDIAGASAVLAKYGVTYVYVGDLEQQTFGSAGLAKFERFMDPVFRQGGVTIYRRRP